MNINKKIANFYENHLKNLGESKFYKKVLGECVLQRATQDYPEIHMLNTADGFFALSRRTGNHNYFIIGKILRKAAHRLYRDSQRRYSNYPTDKRFLALIK